MVGHSTSLVDAAAVSFCSHCARDSGCVAGRTYLRPWASLQVLTGTVGLRCVEADEVVVALLPGY